MIPKHRSYRCKVSGFYSTECTTEDCQFKGNCKVPEASSETKLVEEIAKGYICKVDGCHPAVCPSKCFCQFEDECKVPEQEPTIRINKKSTPDNVNHPQHYAGHCSMECIDSMLIAFDEEAVVDFCKLSAYKYLWRYKEKGGFEDLQKAKWYLKEAKELREFSDNSTLNMIKVVDKLLSNPPYGGIEE